ncbi:hypothetical protein F4824DRAFT_45631 [Ustulina deusta]|nr:hypothetical protein F4824DRAFT_45631 [Ustulina deusta]
MIGWLLLLAARRSPGKPIGNLHNNMNGCVPIACSLALVAHFIGEGVMTGHTRKGAHGTSRIAQPDRAPKLAPTSRDRLRQDNSNPRLAQTSHPSYSFR